MGKITDQERLFIEAYSGDEIEALKLAGFQGSNVQLKNIYEKMIVRPEIILAIKERDKFTAGLTKVIADRNERKTWWSALMRNDDPYIREEKDEFGAPKPPSNLPLAIRIKASENLAKCDGDFIESLHVSGNVSVSDIVMKSFSVNDEDLDAIEAEYELLREQKLLREEKPIEAIVEPESVSSLDDLL